jgi:predicted nucleic acid-binding protein
VYVALSEGRLAGIDRFTLHAPPLMWSEALSALVEAAYRGAMPDAVLPVALERIEVLPVRSAGGDRAHRRSVLEIAQALRWAKTYDAEYVALARSLRCPLLTVDARLQRGAGRLIEVLGPTDIGDR